MQELYSNDDDFSTTKYDTNVGVSWSSNLLGRFSLSYYRNQTWNSDYDSRSILSSWSNPSAISA
jgi:outer membrane usher protein FimD/PapC